MSNVELEKTEECVRDEKQGNFTSMVSRIPCKIMRPLFILQIEESRLLLLVLLQKVFEGFFDKDIEGNIFVDRKVFQFLD
jgi:hypothetical protein